LGVQITHARQSFISNFGEALHPAKRLTEQIQLLDAATNAAMEMGQPIDGLARKSTSLESRSKLLMKDIADLQKILRKCRVEARCEFSGTCLAKPIKRTTKTSQTAKKYLLEVFAVFVV
jgi:hypothetical protein